MLEPSQNGIETLMKFYKFAMSNVELTIRFLLEETELANENNPLCSDTKIRSRLKELTSITDKCQRRHINNQDVEAITTNIRDIAGVRLICEYQDEVYEALDLIKAHYGDNLLEVEDYIKNPKPSGYRSIHCIIAVPVANRIIPVEVQLRTECQEDWARFEGKVRYKKSHRQELTKDCSNFLNDYAKTCAEADANKTKIRISSAFS